MIGMMMPTKTMLIEKGSGFRTMTASTGIEPDVLDAIGGLVMELAFDLGIEERMAEWAVEVIPYARVFYNRKRIEIPLPSEIKRFARYCLHELIHIRRSDERPRYCRRNDSWADPLELSIELEARERLKALSTPSKLALLKLVSVMSARNADQEEALARAGERRKKA